MKKLSILCLAPLLIPVTGVEAQEEELPFPEGWEVRFDRSGSSMDDVTLVEMPPGMHVTTGPALIAYHPDSTAAGSYRLESETFLFDPGTRREAFGFFIGGSDLQGAGQQYLYFLVRNGGEFLVKTRDGTSTGTVVDWTAHPAIVSYDPESGANAKNVLAVEVEAGALRFFVNGEEVWVGSAGEAATDGVFGLRVNHGLNLHITSLIHSPLG